MVTRRKAKAAGAALVTGAARRIGREIALALARDGWDIAVHYATSRDEALQVVAEIESLGRRAVAVNRDLAVEAGVRSLLAECSHELGAVSCVVNNASLFEYDDAAGFTAEALARMTRTNTAAPVLLAQSLHASLRGDERGVVVNLLDQKLWNPAQALAPRVRVVGVAPGITLPSGDQTAAGFASAHARTPLGRSSEPADVAAAVAYLVGARAITGTTLLVDGGQHLAASPRDVMFMTPPEGTAS